MCGMDKWNSEISLCEFGPSLRYVEQNLGFS
jgi:hypothetical protein